MKKKCLCALLALVMVVGICTAVPFKTRAASDMTASQGLIDMLKAFEGFSKYPIWDNSQYSMGYGTVCYPEEYDYYIANGITQEEAEERLKKHVASFGGVVNRFIDKYGITMTQQQFDAVVSLSYNCGDAWFRETTGYLHTALKNGATGNDLLYAFSLWSKSASAVQHGLIRRRLAEANLYLNGVYSTKKPANLSYVIFDTVGGSVNYCVQGFDVNTPAEIKVVIEPTHTVVVDGVTHTYTFDGWYTAKNGGTRVTVLDGSLKEGSYLYAHWKDSQGTVVEPPAPKPTPIDPVVVTVTGTEVNVRRGPGTAYDFISKVTKGTKLTVTETFTSADGIFWGKVGDSSWIALQYTDYDTVIKDPGGSGSQLTGTVIVSDSLRIRSGPGTTYEVVGEYLGGARVIILEQKTVGAAVWGRTARGWISMDYVKLDSTQPTPPPTTPPTVPPTTPPTVPPTKPPTTPPTTPPTKPPYQSWTGTVKVGDTLNIRSGAGTGYAIVGSLKNGDRVTVLEEKTVSGEKWGRINKGWINLQYVIKGDAPKPTEPKPTQPKPTEPRPTQPKPTEPKPTQPKPTDPPAFTPWEGTVTVSDILHIRSGAGTYNGIVGYLSGGARVTILEEKTVAGEKWGRVEKGWISLRYVSPSTGDTPVGPTPTEPAAPTEPKPTEPKPTEPKPTEPNVPGSESWTGVVSVKDTLYVRSQPGFAGKVVGSLVNGAKVNLTQKKTVDGKLWGKVDKGWICLDYVNPDGQAQWVPGIEEPADNLTVLDTPMTMTVNACSLRIRSGAGITNSIVGYLSLGNQVTVTQLQTVGSTVWGRTEAGWVSLKYLK